MRSILVLKSGDEHNGFVSRTEAARYRPVVKDWRLNERHYGALQGLSKLDWKELGGDKSH